jgi:uncharacterized protein YwgA
LNREDITLAALAAANGAMHTPVQVQKLMFLIDRQIPKAVGGPHFNFEPYDYGPFDHAVYRVLEQLDAKGFVETVTGPGLRFRRYRVTDKGQARGVQLLTDLSPKARDYIHRASQFVRKLPFEALVAAIYKAYPEMNANSIFRG